MDIRMKEWQFNIENGPSVRRLLGARPTQSIEGKHLLESKTDSPISFDIAVSYKAPRSLNCEYTKMRAENFVLTKVERIGESNNYIVEGEADVDIVHFAEPYDMKRKKFHTIYNPSTRKGKMTFILY